MMDRANTKATERANKKREKIKLLRDNRRIKVGVPATGKIRTKPMSKNSKRTVYPSKVLWVELNQTRKILSDGKNHRKIGGAVLVGHLKGAKIMALSLEERATCPTTCGFWTTCYGNNMPHTNRWKVDKNFYHQLHSEIHDLCQKHEKVLIRLHVLGDFPDIKYLDFWHEMIDQYENLHIFGFTAWEEGTEIGDEIIGLRKMKPDRWAVRTSGHVGEWGSFTIDFPTEKTMIGGGVVCPEQLDANNDGSKEKHCGNCAVCWQTSHPIVFVEH